VNKKTIRILHVITGLEIGGAETMLYKLLKYSDNSVVTQKVVSMTNGGGLQTSIERLGIEVNSLGMRPGRPNLSSVFQLVALIRQFRPDVVQTWLYHADLLGTIAAKLVPGTGLCWNIRCSDMGPDYYQGLNGIVIRLLALFSPLTDAVIVNSEFGKFSHISKSYTPNNWHVLPNGFDVDCFVPNFSGSSAFRKEIRINENDILIGHVGRWDPVKGHKYLLEASASVLTDIPNAHLALVGKGLDTDNNELMDLIRGTDSERIHMMGVRSDIAEVTASFDIAVLPSLSEGFPNTLGEAMSSSVPCVVTDVGDCAEIVGLGGIVIPPADSKALAKALISLANQTKSHRRALGERNRQRIIDHFSMPDIVDRYMSLYMDIKAKALA
jgi:glycosyltransferase involved in cell wall biosynthesis